MWVAIAVPIGMLLVQSILLNTVLRPVSHRRSARAAPIVNVNPDVAKWIRAIRHSQGTYAAVMRTFRSERPAPGEDQVPANRRLAVAASKARTALSNQADGLGKMIPPGDVQSLHKAWTGVIRDGVTVFSRMKKAADENDLRQVRSSRDELATLEVRADLFAEKINEIDPPYAHD